MTLEQVQAPSKEELEALNERLAASTPQEILQWAVDVHGDRLILACSFGGISGMALLDMAVKIKPDIAIFYLDTDFLFPETYKLKEQAATRYNVQPLAFRSRLTPEQQASQHGDKLWERDPDACCAVRKVEPNKRALEGRTAWIAGLRRDQASTRRNMEPVAWDAKFGLHKISPLAYWDEKQVWKYIFANDVPYNPLHDEGYPSIGCTYCTRTVGQGEDMRAGRWNGQNKVECGLHK